MNKYINDVQYEFGVCFSLDDRETSMSVDKFVERIEKLMQSRRGSLRSLTNQERAGAGWGLPVFLNLLLIGFAIAFHNILWLSILLTIVALAITGGFLMFDRDEKLYLQRLRSRIESHG